MRSEVVEAERITCYYVEVPVSDGNRDTVKVCFERLGNMLTGLDIYDRTEEGVTCSLGRREALALFLVFKNKPDVFGGVKP